MDSLLTGPLEEKACWEERLCFHRERVELALQAKETLMHWLRWMGLLLRRPLEEMEQPKEHQRLQKGEVLQAC
jgi:hypothetical protein